MTTNIEWRHYYESKVARKLGVSTTFARKLAESGKVRSVLITRNNGSTFYALNADDVDKLIAEVRA